MRLRPVGVVFGYVDVGFGGASGGWPAGRMHPYGG